MQDILTLNEELFHICNSFHSDCTEVSTFLWKNIARNVTDWVWKSTAEDFRDSDYSWFTILSQENYCSNNVLTDTISCELPNCLTCWVFSFKLHLVSIAHESVVRIISFISCISCLTLSFLVGGQSKKTWPTCIIWYYSNIYRGWLTPSLLFSENIKKKCYFTFGIYWQKLNY